MGKISTNYSLDDLPLLGQHYVKPMCFLQRCRFAMCFIQRLQPHWGEWGIKRCTEYMVNLQRYSFQCGLCNLCPQQGQGMRAEGCLASNVANLKCGKCNLLRLSLDLENMNSSMADHILSLAQFSRCAVLQFCSD